MNDLMYRIRDGVFLWPRPWEIATAIGGRLDHDLVLMDLGAEMLVFRKRVLKN